MNILSKKTLLVFLFLVLIFVGFFALKPRITGNLIKNPEQNFTHSFTKAICDKENYCRDYEVVCNKKNLVRINPTGFGIQKPSDWKDPRTPEEIGRLCG